jgi:Mce-associated membrane protein
MSDNELRPETLEAGHRKAPKAATKADKSKAKSEKKAAKSHGALPKGRPGGGALGKARAGMVGAFGPFRKMSAGVWRVWDRAYDDAVACPARAVKRFGILVAAMALLGGLCWAGSYHYSSLNSTRSEAAQAGEDAVAQLLSYNWRSLDRQVAKNQDLVTGKFKDDYAQLVNTTIAPTARNKQISSQTSVDRSAIVSSSSDQVVLLMYIDQESSSQLNPSADSASSSVRVTLQKEGDKWKVSEITPV